MTTNLTKTNNQQAKELWEIYQENDFIDAKDNQGDWRVGQIIEKNPVTKLFKVRFDGWSSKYDQIYRFNSAKLLDFRSIIVGYTGQIKHPGIRMDWKFNIKDHEKRLEQLKLFRQNPESFTAREINQLIRGHNYLYTDFLMTKTYDSIETISSIMQFFKMNIAYCVEYLKEIDPQFTQYYRAQNFPQEMHTVNARSALAHAFYEIIDTTYIIAGGYTRLNSFFENSGGLLKKYMNLDFEKNVKRYYQLFICQQFIGNNGFEVLEELIYKKLDKSKCIIPFLFIKSIVALYNVMSSQSSYQDRAPTIQKLVSITIRNIEKLNDKHIKDLNKNHVSELLESIKGLFEEDNQKREQIEMWALETQVKLCKLMIQCPFFQKKLKGVINLIEIAEKNKLCPDSDLFIDVLMKHNILQCLFSIDNAQIIKKSADLCKTLFYMDAFPKKSIYKIWEMRIGKHESALQEIYSLIPVIPSRPNDPQFNIELFQEISKIPREQWDEDYIKMIKEYSMAAIGWIGVEQEVKSTYGFSILYEYLLMKKNDFALGCFIQILDRLQKTDIVPMFVKDVFIKIGDNKESHIHTLLILKIIQQHLCDLKTIDFDFSEPLIKDILRHTDQPVEIVEKKFELFSEITKLTATAITFQEFTTLWSEFKGKKGEIAFYNWVLKKKDGGRSQLNTRISSDIRKKIFWQIWNENYDYSHMSQKQSEIFIEFFKSINAIKGYLKKINIIIKTETLELESIDKMWEALIKCSKQKIVDTIADLLAEIHMNPSKHIEEKREEWVCKLVKQISQRLQVSYKQNNIDEINRYLLVLKQIIERDEQNFQTKYQKYSMMKEYNVVYKANKEEKAIRFNVGGFCYDFKKMVSERFKIPFKRFKLSCKNEPIKYENYFKSMLQCSFMVGAPFQIQLIPGEIPSIKQSLNSELSLFFDLLGDHRIERNVWEIVSRLPIDKQFMLKIEHSEEPWKQINDVSIYKQLYMLRVIGLMKDKWWDLFVRGDGLKTLVSKFERISTNTKIEREYLKMLLEAIDKCLSLPERNLNINVQKLILDSFKALKSMYDNIQLESAQYKRNSVETLITNSVFRICEKLLPQVNIISILINSFPELQHLLLNGLVKTNSAYLRKEFATKMMIFNQHIEMGDTNVFLGIVLQDIFEKVCQSKQAQQTFQYFQYSASLIRNIRGEVFKGYICGKNPELLRKVESGLLNEKPEKNIETINFMLIGYLLLMKELIKYASQDFKKRICEFVIYQCFFSHLKAKGIDNKCKSKQSRKVGFALLAAIVEDGKIIKEPLQLLSDLHKNALWRTRKQEDWTLTVGDKLKSASGYVGLKNLGCTCYMNSFFQQIYMIPEFRRAIIQCEDPYEGKELENENVLFQVKKMFYNLNESEKKYYTPTQFCHAFKNYQGQPTNVHEQMDIDQFSGILFDRLENQMRGTNHENVIKDFFGGVFSNEIICKGCPHFSQTEESFLSISLSVKNKKNIYQSFDTMIKGDTLDGDNAYFCERCNTKVSAVKRVCLKTLPDHLILTLKRFEFDYSTMTKMKINDYCEFPIELNVKEYSQQYLRRQENPDRFDEEDILPDSYYDYVLKGVAIHLGYADSGHYYSYINERKPNGKWFQFNDTTVRHFDVKRLPQQAFGGQTGTFETKEKIKNAYMLIYERKSKIHDFSKYCQKKNEELMRSPIYKNLSDQIHRQNVLQKIQNILFSEEYNYFALEVLAKTPTMQPKISVFTLKYIILVYLTVTIREKDAETSFKFLKKIHPIILQYPEVCEWVIKVLCAQNSLIQFMKNNPSKQVKKLLASWIIQLAQHCQFEVQCLVVDSLLASMTLNHQNSFESCYILSQLIKKAQICQYSLKKQMIGRMLENLVRKDPPNFKEIDGLSFQESAVQEIGSEVVIEKTPYQLSKKLKPMADNTYVWVILNRVVNLAKQKEKSLLELVSEIEADYMQLNSTKIYKTLQESKGKLQINCVTDYLSYFAYKNEDFSNILISLIHKGLSEFESKRYRQFFILFKKLINIDDEFREGRTKKGLMHVMKAVKENQKYAFDSNIIQQWLVKIIRKNRILQKIILQEKDILDYLTKLATKKIPTEDICRKNTIFLESTVNKYHGIRMLKSTKKYLELSKDIEGFYLELAAKKIPKENEWDSDEDLTEKQIHKGDIIGFFDQKDVIDFVEVKVEEVFLKKLWVRDCSNSKSYLMWKDDERLTEGNFKREKDESTEGIFYSDNTDLEDDDQNDEEYI